MLNDGEDEFIFFQITDGSGLDESNDSIAQSTDGGLNGGGTVTFSGVVGDGFYLDRDVDFFAVTVPGGASLLADVDAQSIGSGLDSFLRVFDDNGTPLTTFFGDAERLSKWAQERVDSNPDAIKARLRVKSLEPDWRFNRPTAVATGDDGKILVAESQRMRIQIYQKEKDWVDPQFNL